MVIFEVRAYHSDSEPGSVGLSLWPSPRECPDARTRISSCLSADLRLSKRYIGPELISVVGACANGATMSTVHYRKFTSDFVHFDEESFQTYRPGTFRHLLEGFTAYK